MYHPLPRVRVLKKKKKSVSASSAAKLSTVSEEEVDSWQPFSPTGLGAIRGNGDDDEDEKAKKAGKKVYKAPKRGLQRFAME